ncbi:MAG: hypothetical protein ACFNJJ_08115, partial [Lachnoanaerobaculum saburreum]
MRKFFIVTALILCTSVLFSCGLANKEKSVEQNLAFVNNQYEDSDNKADGLSESDIEELKWLIQTLYVSHWGASNILGKGSVLDTKEKQAEFLDSLNEMEYENIFRNSLRKYVVFEDDKKLINSENAELILKMAGALSTAKVWQYLSQNYSQYMESEDIFEMPLYAREGSDYFIEFRDWKFIGGEDGKLTVRYKIYKPIFRRDIEYVEVRLHKDEKSVFGGYSADYMMATPIELEETAYEKEEFFQGNTWGEYRKPLTMGDSIDDYIFRLDGSLYQMPFPLDELTSKGWEYTENLKKDEERDEITLKKGGKEIYCIVWYCQIRDDPKWYVVSLKTGFGEEISDVDFELFGNRKRGDYAYGYGVHGIYGFSDPLYLEAGIGVYAGTGSDKTIKGFTMTYAPKYMDRIERLNEIATDVKGEVNLTGKGNTELERDVSYKLTMYDEPLYVQVKSLDKVGWAKEMDIIWVKKGTKEDIIG